MAAAARDTISEAAVRKAVNALLKFHSHRTKHEQREEESDDFIYLSLTLKKKPPPNLTLTPHRIPLRHSLFPTQLNTCLIIDGKRITSQTALNLLKNHAFPFTVQVMKLSKLKSDYNTFISKKKLYDSFDVFFAAKNVVPLLPAILGKMFYKKKRKIPVPLSLMWDGSNWKEEIEGACNSSLLRLSGGTCSSVRVGRWGVNEGKEIVENVFDAIDKVLEIVPKKWGGVRCLHLKFSDSVALPIYEHKSVVLPDNGLVGVKRKRSALLKEDEQEKERRETKSG